MHPHRASSRCTATKSEATWAQLTDGGVWESVFGAQYLIAEDPARGATPPEVIETSPSAPSYDAMDLVTNREGSFILDVHALPERDGSCRTRPGHSTTRTFRVGVHDPFARHLRNLERRPSRRRR